jgi:hypothetical protein
VILAWVVAVLGILAQTPAPAPPPPPPSEFFVAGNFPRDLYGDLDTRSDTWGYADSQTLPIQFYPPAGYRVEILEIHGDLIAAPKPPAGQSVAAGSYGYVLVGFSTSALIGYPGPGVPCNYCATGAMIYLQGGLSDQPLRIPFDRVFRRPVSLESDNILNLKLASFLNTTGFPIHTEATYTIWARYVPTTASR